MVLACRIIRWHQRQLRWPGNAARWRISSAMGIELRREGHSTKDQYHLQRPQRNYWSLCTPDETKRNSYSAGTCPMPGKSGVRKRMSIWRLFQFGFFNAALGVKDRKSHPSAAFGCTFYYL